MVKKLWSGKKKISMMVIKMDIEPSKEDVKIFILTNTYTLSKLSETHIFQTMNMKIKSF